MYPIIKNSSGQTLAVMNNITSNSLKEKINLGYTFDFRCFEEHLKSEYIQFGNVVEIGNQIFDIAYIDTSHNIAVEYDVKCEHVFHRLDEELFNFASTGTPTQILATLLTGTDFTVGTIEFTNPVVFAVNRNASKMNIIISLANSLGAEIGFDGFSINFFQTLGEDNGYEIRIKKNLQGINKVIDKRGTNKAIYKISAVNIFKSDEMVLRGLGSLETLSLGDKVQIIDETINVNESLYIIEIERDVIKEAKLNIVLGDSFDYLADKISFIENQAIKQSDVIYGVKVNNSVGIEIERYDQLARTKLNADEFRMQTGDGLGNYTDALYFDPINAEYLFVGKIIGGSIKIGTGFEVDENGVLTATGADISGDISLGAGSTIDWNYVNTDPDTTTALNTANSASSTASTALTVAQQIANGTYSGGTFINGTTIYSPNIFGNTITVQPTSSANSSQQFNLNAWFGGSLLNVLRISSFASASPYVSFSSSNGAYAFWDFGSTLFNGNLNFQNATVSGLNVVAKFG